MQIPTLQNTINTVGQGFFHSDFQMECGHASISYIFPLLIFFGNNLHEEYLLENRYFTKIAFGFSLLP